MIYEILAKIEEGEIVYYPKHRRGDSLGKKIRTAERARALNNVDKIALETDLKGNKGTLRLLDIPNKNT